jgi:glutathione S-transferase
VKEIHDTHHPISSALYYEQQRAAAKQYTKAFWQRRVPKMMGYFEAVLEHSGGPFVFGRTLSYVDLSLFQIVEGLRYAFPKRMARFEKTVPRLAGLRDRVAKRPNIGAYLKSDRRIAFNEWGIFRHYPELDTSR